MWGSNSQPWDQELHAPLTEPARCPMHHHLSSPVLKLPKRISYTSQLLHEYIKSTGTEMAPATVRRNPFPNIQKHLIFISGKISDKQYSWIFVTALSLVSPPTWLPEKPLFLTDLQDALQHWSKSVRAPGTAFSTDTAYTTTYIMHHDHCFLQNISTSTSKSNTPSQAHLFTICQSCSTSGGLLSINSSNRETWEVS